MRKINKNNCLAIKRPDLARQWHTIKNGTVTPYDVFLKSNKKYWWQCKKNHEWEASPNSRSRNYKNPKNGFECGTNCPYCANQKVCEDNCLATMDAKLAQEWHLTKNGTLTPHNVTCGSNRLAWWQCKNGHEWRAHISTRHNQGTGCPYCLHRKICKDNCLSAMNPKLSKEWDFKKNYPLTPDDVFPRSGKKWHWICKINKSHKWQATVAHRSGGNGIGTGCPYCNNKLATKETQLKLVNPTLFQEWHPTKNKYVDINNVIYTSDKMVWWQCKKCNFEWKARVRDRNDGKKQCLRCNSIAIKNPKIFKEWDFTMNKGIDPYTTSSGSNKRVGWKCKKEHRWNDSINSRNNKNTQCPYCYGRYVTKDNCLAVKYPRVASHWHPTKNGKITPWDVLPCSDKEVWWECDNHHVWKSKIINQRLASDCPYCAAGVILKNGTHCTSIPEAIMWLTYEKSGNEFLYHGHYGGKLKRKIYDFYFPKENKYVEVTSFLKNYKYWKKYYSNILKKKNYAENILGAKFEFIQFTPTKEQIEFVRNNSK